MPPPEFGETSFTINRTCCYFPLHNCLNLYMYLLLYQKLPYELPSEDHDRSTLATLERNGQSLPER